MPEITISYLCLLNVELSGPTFQLVVGGRDLNGIGAGQRCCTWHPQVMISHRSDIMLEISHSKIGKIDFKTIEFAPKPVHYGAMSLAWWHHFFVMSSHWEHWGDWQIWGIPMTTWGLRTLDSRFHYQWATFIALALTPSTIPLTRLWQCQPGGTEFFVITILGSRLPWACLSFLSQDAL